MRSKSPAEKARGDLRSKRRYLLRYVYLGCYVLGMPDTRDTGAALVARRKAIGMSQRKLGQMLGASQPQIARWEKNHYRTASMAKVEAAASALGMSLQAVAHSDPLYAAEARATYTAAEPALSDEAAVALSRIGVDQAAIAAFCRLRGIEELSLFGSVLRDDFQADSDIDVLVTYKTGSSPTGFAELADTERALGGLFRRPADLVDRRALERSANYLRRRNILENARSVYVAR